MRLPALSALILLGASPLPGASAQPADSTDADVAAIWRVDRYGLDDDAAFETLEHMARYGEDWASWTLEQDDEAHLDLTARTLTTVDSAAQTAIVADLHAEARRRLDIYVALSEGGRRDVISFGAAGTFDRVWLEAAMGVASQPDALTLTAAGSGFEAYYGDQMIFRADFGEDEASSCEQAPLVGDPARTARAWLPHAAPIHPDVHRRLAAEPAFPCAFEFVVYSPDSPTGRREVWTRIANPTNAGPTAPDALEALALTPSGAERFPEVVGAYEALASDSAPPAPDPITFFEDITALAAAGDFAGALLLSVQETHHFGPCPEAMIGSIRLSCANVGAIAAQAQDDPDHQRAAEGVAAFEAGDHALAVDLLSAFLDREDRAGAAARILVADALVAWGRVGLQMRPDLDPAGLLAEAVTLDPYAPDAYWRLAQRYLAAGAPGPAWTLMDYGRRLPGREPTPALSEVDALEARMQALAPVWLPFATESN